MAKKKKEPKQQEKEVRRASRWRFTDMLAFLALAAAAILLLIGPLLGWLLNNEAGHALLRALNIIAQYCLLAAIAIPAWYFVRGKRRGWKVFYIIVLVIYIAGTVLGVTLGI